MLAHEKLIAYQKAISFAAWCGQVLESIPSKISAKDQLDRASTSVPLNLAEGNAKFSTKDKSRYIQTAYGSALECSACLDVLEARSLITPDLSAEGKQQIESIAYLIMGLLNHLGYRFNEEQAPYNEGPSLVEKEKGEEKEREIKYPG